jgi:hypothetical protein
VYKAVFTDVSSLFAGHNFTIAIIPAHVACGTQYHLYLPIIVGAIKPSGVRWADNVACVIEDLGNSEMILTGETENN